MVDLNNLLILNLNSLYFRFVDGHVCVPAVAVQPITAVEWDLADGQTLADAWRRGDARTPSLIYARFKGGPFLVIL